VWQSCEVFGIRNGFAGLIQNALIPLSARNVGRISHLGGTMLGSARCEEFRTERGIGRAAASLKAYAIEGLIVIGGNGSQAGAHAL
jgi:6-phosphofructokinase 1